MCLVGALRAVVFKVWFVFSEIAYRGDHQKKGFGLIRYSSLEEDENSLFGKVDSSGKVVKGAGQEGKNKNSSEKKDEHSYNQLLRLIRAATLCHSM